MIRFNAPSSAATCSSVRSSVITFDEGLTQRRRVSKSVTQPRILF
jgi:hypothetical protein